ncbi:hypothetical protein ACFL35_21945 [Candidatus Riflebacteria bacterium]
MKQKFISTLLFSTIFSLFIATNLSARAMWLWDTDRFLHSELERRELFAFSKYPPAGGEPVKTIYFSANLHNNPEKLAEFIKQAHSHGLKVEYLSGDSNWAYDRLKDGKGVVDAFVDFQKSLPADAQFDGMQLDVEPHDNAKWNYQNKTSEENQQAWKNYIELLKYSREKIRSVEKQTGKKLVLGAAIPDWFDHGVTDHKQVQDILDYVAMMSYHDSGETTLARVQEELDYANEIGKKVVVGAETLDLGEKRNNITFAEEGLIKMEDELSKITTPLKQNSSYAGLAIHYYTSYRNLSNFDEYDNLSDAEFKQLLNSKKADLERLEKELSGTFFIFFWKKDELRKKIAALKRELGELQLVSKRKELIKGKIFSRNAGKEEGKLLQDAFIAQNKAFKAHVDAIWAKDPERLKTTSQKYKEAKENYRRLRDGLYKPEKTAKPAPNGDSELKKAYQAYNRAKDAYIDAGKRSNAAAMKRKALELKKAKERYLKLKAVYKK